MTERIVVVGAALPALPDVAACSPRAAARPPSRPDGLDSCLVLLPG
ncbi:hypothetical protein [Streptomyces sp. NK08204]|nr:hypothetical protein [Streptomyces sp. NK08204]